MSQPTLKDIFYQLQEQMIITLSGNRAIITHPGAKGGASELHWIEWLRKYLPQRYNVDKAFIIDSNNHISQEIDLVIYDQLYSPFIFKQDGVTYIPAESVYAVFEVKQEFDKPNLRYAADKIKSVRLLTRTSATIHHAGGKIDNPKPPFKILGGILTLSSTWTNIVGEPFQEIVYNLNEHEQIDIGCVLEQGSFIVDYNNQNHQISSQEEALIYFFLKLLIKLQKLGTAPALDIEQYARAIDSM